MMRPSLLLLSLTTVWLTCRGQSNTSDGAPVVVKELAPAELAAMLKTTKPFVVDVNEDFMFAEAHVPGAVLMVYDEITVEKLPTDPATPLVFYCYSPECPAGCMAASTAMKLGHTDVYCMSAGIVGWQDAGLATEP